MVWHQRDGLPGYQEAKRFVAESAADGGCSSLEGPNHEGLVGTWKLTGESPYGILEHELVVGADGKATYESAGQVSEVTNLEIEGNKVRFLMTVFGGPTSYDVAFEGTFDEDGLTGDILTGGSSFATLRATR